ncbi:MAG: hypothetical protein QW057_00140 [Candidatus Bathyarchaeia archaeon]
MESPQAIPKYAQPVQAAKTVCLLSGGIDSPVAAWLLIRRGYIPVFVYFDNYPFTDETTRARALNVARILCRHLPGGKARLYVTPHGNDLAEILRRCSRKLTCILCRRMMYRVAEAIAAKEDASSIATGEILGEHASQTSGSLQVISDAVRSLPVLRPLIAMDKVEVEHLARKIGTYAISTSPGLCCSGPPRYPATHPSRQRVEEAERSLRIEEMVAKDLLESEIIELNAS